MDAETTNPIQTAVLWHWRSFAVGLLLIVPAGCAVTTQRPPTPASKVSMTALDGDGIPNGERYYGLVFGSQINRVSFRNTHTWATVVRIKDNDTNTISVDTISWMPTAGAVRPWHFRTEPGSNADLSKTLDIVIGQGQRVAVWGPFEIRPGLYRKFLMQMEFMESGAVGYQANDSLGEAALKGDGCNCIHAITDLDSKWGRAGYPLFRVGFPASKYIVRRMQNRDAVIPSGESLDWLYVMLGLDRYNLERQPMPKPALRLP